MLSQYDLYNQRKGKNDGVFNSFVFTISKTYEIKTVNPQNMKFKVHV